MQDEAAHDTKIFWEQLLLFENPVKIHLENTYVNTGSVRIQAHDQQQMELKVEMRLLSINERSKKMPALEFRIQKIPEINI